MVKKIILVMAEYMVGDSPLWHRGSADSLGTADAGELGLSSHLRRDLREWNDVYDSLGEPDYAWPSDEVADEHATESFTLAARVQLELGDDAHVWCGAGGGIDTVTEQGASVVLSSLHPGTDLESWRHGRRDIRVARDLGLSGATAEAIIHWRALTKREGTRFGDADTRARGLTAAGLVQADIGAGEQVIFYSGHSEPYRQKDAN
jgi:hypothetical protein